MEDKGTESIIVEYISCTFLQQVLILLVILVVALVNNLHSSKFGHYAESLSSFTDQFLLLLAVENFGWGVEPCGCHDLLLASYWNW